MLVFWLMRIWAIQKKIYFTLLPNKITSQKLPELYNTESEDFKKTHQKSREF